MTERRLRVAGWGTTPDGAEILWSIAEGRRGRRWREVVSRDGAMVHALLFESGPDRRFRHLELATREALVSLHPEPDGTMHGNSVDPSEPVVRHVIGLVGGPDGLVLVDGSTVGAAAVAWQLAGAVPVGERSAFDVVRLGPTGTVARSSGLSIEHRQDGRWQIGEGEPFEVADDGQPQLRRASVWPLELD